jgi:hypothetical protein
VGVAKMLNEKKGNRKVWNKNENWKIKKKNWFA